MSDFEQARARLEAALPIPYVLSAFVDELGPLIAATVRYDDLQALLARLKELEPVHYEWGNRYLKISEPTYQGNMSEYEARGTAQAYPEYRVLARRPVGPWEDVLE